MKVSVGFLGILRDQMGQKSLEVGLPEGADFAEFLRVIAPIIQQKAAWAWDGTNGRFASRVVVTRKNVPGKIEPGSLLSDGEELVVFPPLAGG